MDSIDKKFENLNQFNNDELIDFLDDIFKLSENDQLKYWESISKHEILKNQLNKVNSPNPDSRLIEFIANSCKNSICRKFFTKDTLIKHLLEFLDSNDYNLVKQSCRSIGNICFENESACQLIYKNDGIKKIIELLNLDNLNSLKLDEKLELKRIIFGCLLNVLNDKLEYQEFAIEHNLIKLIIEALELKNDKKLNQESIIYNCVLVLFLFLDNDSTIEHLKNSKLILILLKQIQNLNLKQLKTIDELDEIDLETVESIIDLIMQICNNEEHLKSCLIENDLLELLIDLLDHELIDEEQLLKISSNLIMTLILDEKISNKYYNNGKGFVYLKAKKWLNLKTTDELNDNFIDEQNQDLIEKDDSLEQKSKPKSQFKENTQLITGALIIGNFACDNDNSISICKDNLIDKLIKITELNDINIQFACLSALRNLSIPDFNKRYFIDNGLLTRLLRLNYSESPLVVFKYLAILRLITDRQADAALEILNDHKLIDNLKIWGNLDSLTGVKAEASRLLANLFKNFDETKQFNYEHLMNSQLLKLLFEMIKSDHLKMQNEAINGIGYLINKFKYNQIVYDLLENKQFLNNLENLIKSYTLKDELNDFEIKFIQNILSVLSFRFLKYKLKLNNDLLKQIENLKHPNLESNIKMILKLNN